MEEVFGFGYVYQFGFYFEVVDLVEYCLWFNYFVFFVYYYQLWVSWQFEVFEWLVFGGWGDVDQCVGVQLYCIVDGDVVVEGEFG